MAVNNKPVTPSRGRVGGSGYTVWTWQKKTILYARQVSDQSPTPVGPGTVPIHPMDQRHPVELITPNAATMGTLILELYETFNQKIWDRLAVIAGADDIVDIFNAIANLADSTRPSPGITIAKKITPPNGTKATSGTTSGNNSRNTQYYHGCVVSLVDDNEVIEVGTMEVLKRITLNYTHTNYGENS